MWNCVPSCNITFHCGVAAIVHYLRWKSVVSCRTSSQMWGSWNLPTFLLMDGSSTLMNIASFKVLVMLCAFLPTIGKLSTIGLPAMYQGAHNLTLESMFLSQRVAKTPLGRVYAPVCTYFGVIYGKYYLLKITISLRPDEAMFYLVWQKLVCNKINSVKSITRIY